MNADNIKDHQFKSSQSREEAAKNGAEGGKKSGMVRRKKRAMRKTLETLMKISIPPSMKDLRDKLSTLGVEEKMMDYNTAIGFALITKAVKGDTKAYEIIRDTLGEKDGPMDDNEGVSAASEAAALRKELLNRKIDGVDDDDEV